MKQYLLSIYQPDEGTPPPEVLDKVMREVFAFIEETKSGRRLGLQRRPAPAEHGDRRPARARRLPHH